MRLYFGERSPTSTLRISFPSGLPDVKAREPANRDVLLKLGDVFLDQLLDGVRRLAEVRLLQQDVLLQESLHLALDDLRDDLLGLAILLGLGLVEIPLVNQDFVRDVLPRNPAGLIARNLQRKLLRQLAEV